MKKDDLNSRAATDSGDIRQNEVEVGDFHLLAVGINLYDHVGWNDLKSANNDVAALCALMELRYGFKEENIVLIPEAEATKGAILSALRDFSPLRKSTKKLGPNDSLLIWLAGHGQRDLYEQEDEESDVKRDLKRLSYFIPKNAPAEYCAETWINFRDFVSNLELIRARHILVVSDSCFSAGIFERNESDLGPDDSTVEAAKGEMRFTSRRALTSDADMRTVIDLGPYQDHSVFAYPALSFLERNQQSHLSSSGFAWNIKKDMSPKWKSFQRPREGKLDIDGNKGGQFAFILESSIYEFSESEFKERKSHYLNIVATPVVEKQIQETEKPKVALNKKPKKDANAEFKKILRSPSVDQLQAFIFEFPTDKNSPEAYYQIGLLSCGNKKFVEGHNAFLKAATRNHSSAMMAIGHQYNDGHGVDQDFEAALDWYSKAAEHGNLDAKHLFELIEKRKSEEAKDQFKPEVEESLNTTDKETNENSSKSHLFEGHDKKSSDETKTAETATDTQLAKGRKRSKKKLAYIFSAIIFVGILTTTLVRDNIQKLDSQAAKQQAVSINTVAGFESLVELFPEHSKYVKAEILRLDSEEITRNDESAFKAANETNTIAAYEFYLSSFPEGKFSIVAANRIKNLKENELEQARLTAIAEDNAAWDDAKREDTSNSYSNYLKKFEDGAHIEEATLLFEQREEEELFDKAKGIVSEYSKIIALQQYIVNYPKGKYVEQADELAWSAAKKSSASNIIKAYISRFPNGKYLEAAKTDLPKIKEKEDFQVLKRKFEIYPSGLYWVDGSETLPHFITSYPNSQYLPELKQLSRDYSLKQAEDGSIGTGYQHVRLFNDNSLISPLLVESYIHGDKLSGFSHYTSKMENSSTETLLREIKNENKYAIVQHAFNLRENSPVEAFKLLQKYQYLDDFLISRNLATFYNAGKVVEKDEEKALKILEENCDINCLDQVVYLYLKLGRKSELPQKLRDYTDNSSSPVAEALLGMLYYNDRLFPKDTELSIKYLKSALSNHIAVNGTRQSPYNSWRYLVCDHYFKKGDEFLANHWCSEIRDGSDDHPNSSKFLKERLPNQN